MTRDGVIYVYLIGNFDGIKTVMLARRGRKVTQKSHYDVNPWVIRDDKCSKYLWKLLNKRLQFDNEIFNKWHVNIKCIYLKTRKTRAFDLLIVKLLTRKNSKLLGVFLRKFVRSIEGDVIFKYSYEIETLYRRWMGDCVWLSDDYTRRW